MLFAIVVLMVFCATFGVAGGLSDGRLVDTDTYSWLNRVTDLRYDGEWFDDTLDRVNPTVGHTQHWSRPFDVLLLIGGLAGEPFVGFADALFAWGVMLPCLLGAATLTMLWWGFSDLLDAAGVDALAALVALQLTIAQGFAAGRPDHQALIGFLLVAVVALARRAFALNGSRTQVIAVGAVSALGLWVGVEFVLVVAATMLAVALEWVARGNDTMRRLSVYAAAVASSSLLALVAEHGSRALAQVTLDELSIVFVVSTGVAAVAFAAIASIAVMLDTRTKRAAALATTGALCAAMLVGLFPQLLEGPLGNVDRLYAQARLRHISEIQPLVGTSLRATLNIAVPALSLLPFALFTVIRNARRRGGAFVDRQLHLLLVPAVVYLPLAVGQIRWVFPLNLMLVVPAALAVQRLMHAAAPRAKRVHLGMFAVALAAALWWLPVPFIEDADQQPPRCAINDAVEVLRDPGVAGHEPRRLMALTDYGPELLYRTPHSVFSIPNHRHQPGFTATYRAMATTDAAVAHRILDRNRVDLVLVCTDAVEVAFYGAKPDSFHALLLRGDAPSWMTEIPVPGDEPRFRLYEVNAASTAAGANPPLGAQLISLP